MPSTSATKAALDPSPVPFQSVLVVDEDDSDGSQIRNIVTRSAPTVLPSVASSEEPLSATLASQILCTAHSAEKIVISAERPVQMDYETTD